MASAGAPQPDPTWEGATGDSAGGEDASVVAGASSAEAARPPPKLPTLAPAPEEEGQVATSSPGTRWARLSLPWISFSSPPNQHRGYGRVIVAARTVGFFPFCIRLLRFLHFLSRCRKETLFLPPPPPPVPPRNHVLPQDEIFTSLHPTTLLLLRPFRHGTTDGGGRMNASDKTKTPLPPKTVRRREKTLSQDQQHPWRKKYLQHSCRRQDDTTLSFRHG